MYNSEFMFVKRGAIFEFDVDNLVSKYKRIIDVNDKEKASAVKTGRRPYVVVSSDEYNKFNRTCVICPISSSKPGEEYLPFKVAFEWRTTGSSIISLDEPVTVDCFALTCFRGFIADKILNKIDNALSCVFFGKSEHKEVVIESTASKVKEPICINKSNVDNKDKNVLVVDNKIDKRKSNVEKINLMRRQKADKIIESSEFESAYNEYKNGSSIIELSTRFNISSTTFRDYIKRYEKNKNISK